MIGVNSAISTPSGGSVGIAFDTPAPVVKSVVTQRAKTGRVERGWIGVRLAGHVSVRRKRTQIADLAFSESECCTQV